MDSAAKSWDRRARKLEADGVLTGLAQICNVCGRPMSVRLEQYMGVPTCTCGLTEPMLSVDLASAHGLDKLYFTFSPATGRESGRLD
jgi:hypothetical protein